MKFSNKTCLIRTLYTFLFVANSLILLLAILLVNPLLIFLSVLLFMVVIAGYRYHLTQE